MCVFGLGVPVSFSCPCEQFFVVSLLAELPTHPAQSHPCSQAFLPRSCYLTDVAGIPVSQEPASPPLDPRPGSTNISENIPQHLQQMCPQITWSQGWGAGEERAALS